MLVLMLRGTWYDASTVCEHLLCSMSVLIIVVLAAL